SLTTPDIGAFEFTPLLVDATVISLTEPGNLICGSPAIPVSAVISNFGFGTTSFTTVTAYVTGGTFFDTLSAVSTDSLSNGQTDTVHLGTINFISGGTLTFTVIAHTAGEGNPFNDTVIFSRQINASTAQPALLAYNDSICKGETTVISVDAMPNLDYTWFDVPAGGNAVFSGNPFTTPPLDSSVTYYVEASSPAKFTVGPADNAIGTGANFAGVGGQGLLFEVYRNLRLDSVSVYAFDTGTVYAELTDPSNLMVYNVTGVQVNTPGVKVTIPVGFNIAPGSYRIDANGSTTNGLYRNDSGATYPYTIPGLISITGSTFGLSSYFFFYDWKITATGCPSTRTAAPVHVSADSVVNAGFTYSIGGTGLDVTFDAADDRFSNTYDWDFGDGGSATSGTLTHQYANDGSYTACLTVENSCSQETNCQSFTVCGPFQNSFSSSAFGQTVSFQFNGTGVPASYLWDFGDGNNSTSASPTHTYQTAGTYTVTLISENFCSVSDTASATLIICTTVNAVFTATQVTPNGLAFDFVSFSTGNPASLTWDFGDGTFGTAPLISHTYNEHGSYTVRLIATDACGASDTMTQTVVTCLPADAAFTATVQSDGKSVTTVNNSSGTNLIYFWDFDDNFFSQLPEPSYTYSATGNYTITLIVVDPCGQSDTASQTISIIVGIQDAASGFNVSILPNPNDGDFLVQFTLEKQTEIRMRLWNIWGKAVYDNTAEFAAGKQSQKFSLKRLAKGIYVMELRNEEGAEMRRLAIE
ncbi:MAG TPA: PKD domain-containing protein, partial [Chitinophagales bacterium]|nr:PKD domain-containing protein [Chitinophagales bacterium]